MAADTMAVVALGAVEVVVAVPGVAGAVAGAVEAQPVHGEAISLAKTRLYAALALALIIPCTSA